MREIERAVETADDFTVVGVFEIVDVVRVDAHSARRRGRSSCHSSVSPALAMRLGTSPVRRA